MMVLGIWTRGLLNLIPLAKAARSQCHNSKCQRDNVLSSIARVSIMIKCDYVQTRHARRGTRNKS